MFIYFSFQTPTHPCATYWKYDNNPFNRNTNVRRQKQLENRYKIPWYNTSNQNVWYNARNKNWRVFCFRWNSQALQNGWDITIFLVSAEFIHKIFFAFSPFKPISQMFRSIFVKRFEGVIWTENVFVCLFENWYWPSEKQYRNYVGCLTRILRELTVSRFHFASSNHLAHPLIQTLQLNY